MDAASAGSSRGGGKRCLARNAQSLAAYGDHPVVFGVVESINTTIKAVLRRARGMRDETEMGNRSTDPIRA